MDVGIWLKAVGYVKKAQGRLSSLEPFHFLPTRLPDDSEQSGARARLDEALGVLAGQLNARGRQYTPRGALHVLLDGVARHLGVGITHPRDDLVPRPAIRLA